MNYVEMTNYIYEKFAEERAENSKGFKYLYRTFNRPSQKVRWYGVWKHKNTDMEVFGLYEQGMRLNIRLHRKDEHNTWIDEFKAVGLNAYKDPSGDYWLLIPLVAADVKDSKKLNVILDCIESRYQRLKNKS